MLKESRGKRSSKRGWSGERRESVGNEWMKLGGESK
jgi:hypothetical protein